jgi:lysozyme family protein
MWGLSSRFNPEVADKIRTGPLSKSEALSIIKKKYYDTICCINDVHPSIGFIVFDAKFHGMKEVIKEIQIYLNTVTGAHVASDGMWGPETAYAIKNLSQSEIRSLLEHLRVYSHHLGELAANRVMNFQRRHNLAVYDYTTGFSNRQSNRVTAALSLA